MQLRISVCDGKNREMAANGGRSWGEDLRKGLGWRIKPDLEQDLPLQQSEVVLEVN